MQRRVERANKKLSAKELKQREVTRNFNHVAKLVLTPLERETLHKSIRQYQKSRDVEKLYHMMVFMLTTHDKQKMFPYVRAMLPEEDRSKFDELSIEKQSSTAVQAKHHTSNNFLHPSSAEKRREKKKTSFRKNMKVFTLRKGDDDYIGFSLRGGSEYGLGIYISQIDPLSPAEYCGLEVGDEILAVNSIPLNNVTLNGAVSVITGSNHLKFTINRMRKVPEWKKSKEKTIWYDVRKCKLVPLPRDESEMDHATIRERQVIISVLKSTDYIGMNIRGGNEYGLGIYVSRLDRGGLAEKNNVCVGDQIVAANGTSFENVNHTSAVEFLRAHKTLKLTLKAVGRYPAYKEVYQEYTWSENTSKPPNRPFKQEPDSRLVVSETRIRSRHTVENLQAQPVNNSHGRLSYQQEVLLPRKQDVSYSSLYDEWTSSGFGEGDHNGSYINGRAKKRHTNNFSDIESDYLESGSEQDDYMAFLERKTRQESTSGAKPFNSSPQLHQEASNSLSHHQMESSTIKTHILPDRHTTMYNSSPVIQNNNPYLAYAQVHNKHKKNKNGIVYVQSPENKEPQHQQLSFTENKQPEPVSFKPYNQNHSKSTPSLFTTGKRNEERLSTAYDEFDTYNHLHEPGQNEPSIDYSVDGSEAIVRISLEDGNMHDKNNSHIYSSVEELEKKGDLVVNRKSDLIIRNAQLSDDTSSDSVEDRINHLESRKSQLGSSEIDRIAGKKKNIPEIPIDTKVPHQSKKDNKSGTWATLKKKLTGSEKTKKKKKESDSEAPMSLLKKRGVFESTFGSQMMNNHCVDNYNMMMLEENARALLPKDECEAVIRHVKYYHEKKDLEKLIDVLLQLLDNSDKLQLLKDVRGVIFPYHIGLFDNKVSMYEIKEYGRTATKLHLPLHHNNQRSSKPNKNLMTTVVDEDGHFHIKTVDQHNRDVEHEKEVIKVMRSSLEVTSQSDDDDDNEEEDSDENVKAGSYDLVKPKRRTDGNLTSYSNMDDTIVYISKHKPHLGLVLKGGEGDFPTPVRVHKVLPSGAAADDSNIRPGMVLMSVDDRSLRFLSLPEVLAALKKSYNNKSSVAMKLVLKQPIYKHM